MKTELDEALESVSHSDLDKVRQAFETVRAATHLSAVIEATDAIATLEKQWLGQYDRHSRVLCLLNAVARFCENAGMTKEDFLAISSIAWEVMQKQDEHVGKELN